MPDDIKKHQMDLEYMTLALTLAKRAWGETHPNPMVGAVIVEGDEVVAEGFHARAGEPHAEVMALRNLGRAPTPGAIMYVTLEPCCTAGRTPPCTEAIIKSGIKRVVAGTTDPNPQHTGRGIEILRAAGIVVELSSLEKECADLNIIFNHWITTGKPLFAGKFATTIDGRSATRTGESKWITGEAARKDVMRWRRLFPAIAVGANTVMADNPRLTSRIGEVEWCPIRLIFDRILRTASGQLPQVYTDEYRSRTIVVTSPSPSLERRAILEKQGVTYWMLPLLPDASWFAALREKCVEAGLTGLLIEGGSISLSTFLLARKLDYLFAYRGAKILADDKAPCVFGAGPPRSRLADAYELANVKCADFDTDQLMRGHVVYPAAEKTS
jgi:diaminohydroxyphosphoribosylaminopyrimidine deaminase/5-amino-6-(5-phosphoribosylamino)uracil reductase